MARESSYDLARRLGKEYAKKADEEDLMELTPLEYFEEENPNQSREYYELGLDKFSDVDWEDFYEGFEDGIDDYWEED